MNEIQIVSKINEFLLSATKLLADWLSKRLPKVTGNWFSECVLDNLSVNQLKIAREKGFSKLADFDLAALLTVADKNWYPMRSTGEYLPTHERDCIRKMKLVRNSWAHCSGSLPSKDVILENIATIEAFFGQLGASNKDILSIQTFKTNVEENSSSDSMSTDSQPKPAPTPALNLGDIKPLEEVCLVADPSVTGLVTNVESIGNNFKYTVFVNGKQEIFYSGQITKKVQNIKQDWLDTNTFQSYLTAYEINNPSAGNLYSLNSARIDFVPYQFRPALKLIKSDSPRILIADSVGVGKTIEAGLIIKELEARSELNNIAIICPRPLVAERKWELEMLRFDEEFTPLDGAALRQCLSDVDRDGEWPSRYNRVIIPYSIFDKGIYEGEQKKKARCYGLSTLDPAPHFDLVIVDEAHYIRNGSTEKEKAFAYKCVKYFCDHSDAVVMLTATPLQTKDDDLFTLLNVLRPDLIIDKQTLDMLTRPNEFITMAVQLARLAEDGWQDKVQEELHKAIVTQWGENVIKKNPVYEESLSILERGENIDRDQRVKLISNLESLHSLNSFMNRTRRKDIQDFCIRKSPALEVEFTNEQSELYNELLAFEFMALSKLHNARNVNFMMTTIKRQAASCIFGLAPFIEDIINGRLEDLSKDDSDYETLIEGGFGETFRSIAEQIIQKSKNLSGKDPKFDAVLQIINEKQKEDNNKILVFSTFRHTLAYLKKRLEQAGIRVAQIDGSVSDENRCDLRDRFALPKDDENAIDMLLFTEVGAEGLDYQFCNMMINYDLPWNPMKIEQRIGRIDRRGQTSEVVKIFNPITKGTIDAEIYNRCLSRIGIFERSIGDCDEILGKIAKTITEVVENSNLSETDKNRKLEQIAENEIRKIQELEKLEDAGKGLFGFNLSEYMISKDVEKAESTWIDPAHIENLVKKYLSVRLEKDRSIIGDSENKQIRLAASDKSILMQDFRKLSTIKSAVKRRWETFLKDCNQYHELTFDADAAKTNRKAFFVTATHPLAKQAAQYFAKNEPKYISVKIASNIVPKGVYPFEIYGWNYKGLNSRFQLKIVSNNQDLDTELAAILQEGQSTSLERQPDESMWNGLEAVQVDMLQKARDKHLQDALQLINYREETLRNNYTNQKHLIEQQIKTAADENLIRMRRGELENATARYEAKQFELEEAKKHTDILSSMVAKGLLTVE